jgi:hypothetical protein
MAPSPFPPLLPLLAGFVLLLPGCRGPEDSRAAPPIDEVRAGETRGPEGQEPTFGEGAPADPFPTLSAQQVCPGSGYLCDFLLVRRGDGEVGVTGGSAGRGVRVARWPDDTGVLRIRIDLPPVADADRARELQRAAVRGLLAWDGQPLRLQIEDRNTGGQQPPHIHVTWRDRLGPGQAGRVTTRWELRGTSFRFDVESFELALQVPPEGGGPARSLAPDDVERVAAHEMGHALGLGHSDAPGDLMYPLNTARALSPRDYRTMEALYRLPAGALVVGPATP